MANGQYKDQTASTLLDITPNMQCGRHDHDHHDQYDHYDHGDHQDHGNRHDHGDHEDVGGCLISYLQLACVRKLDVILMA